MFIVENFKIFKLRELTMFIKSSDINKISLLFKHLDDIRNMFNSYNNIRNFSDVKIKDFLFLYKKNINNKKFVAYYDKINGIDFEQERFEKYIVYKKTNKSDSNSMTFFNLVYGEANGFKEYQRYHSKIRELTPYKIEYWINKGFTKNDAELKIIDYKKNKSTSLDGFILRHGEVEGKKLFNKFQKTSKHTLEKYIEKYGFELGTLKYNEYIKTKDSSSFNWALNKTNGNIIEANKLHDVRRKKSNWKSFNVILEKFNGDIEKAKEVYNKYCADSAINYELYLKKFNYDENKAKEEYSKYVQSKTTHIGYTISKESLKIFDPIYKLLIEFGYNSNDIIYGVQKKEKTILDTKYNSMYSYDFTNEKEKYIIEYHGSFFHPNYEKYSIDELKKQKFRFTNKQSIEDKIKYDKRRIYVAKKNGYKVLILWGDDKYQKNYDKCLKFINKNKKI